MLPYVDSGRNISRQTTNCPIRPGKLRTKGCVLLTLRWGLHSITGHHYLYIITVIVVRCIWLYSSY